MRTYCDDQCIVGMSKTQSCAVQRQLESVQIRNSEFLIVSESKCGHENKDYFISSLVEDKECQNYVFT